MTKTETEKWCNLYTIENPYPKDDFDRSYGYAHIWISNGFSKHVYYWSYSKSEALANGGPDLEKFEPLTPAPSPVLENLMACGTLLRERGYFRKNTEIGCSGVYNFPNYFFIFGWTDEIKVDIRYFESTGLDFCNHVWEENRKKLHKHLSKCIAEVVNAGQKYSSDWYLLCILEKYFSESDPSHDTMFNVGVLWGELLSVEEHAEKFRRNEERQSKAATKGGQGKRDQKKQNVLALFEAAKEEAEHGIYDLRTEKEFRKAAVRRAEANYKKKGLAFPTAPKTHSAYFDAITEDPEMKSVYYGLLERA